MILNCLKLIKIKSKTHHHLPSKERKELQKKKNALKDGFLILIAIVGFLKK